MSVRRYGISMVSMFPWCLGLGATERNLSLALEANFDGVQALPLRGVDLKNVARWSQWIISYEHAWNWSPWAPLLFPLRSFGILPTFPTWRDALLFKQEKFPFVRNAIRSVHFWPDEHGRINNTCVEIHPELETQHEVYYARAREGQRFTLDTRHLRRPKGTGDGVGIQDWRGFLKNLNPPSIGLIHVHPMGNEVRQLFLQTGELCDMLRLLKNLAPPETPAILELEPRPMSQKETVRWLRGTLEATKYLLE